MGYSNRIKQFGFEVKRTVDSEYRSCWVCGWFGSTTEQRDYLFSDVNVLMAIIFTG
jgi:hypothetical protein